MISFIEKSITKNYGIILCIDANENVKIGKWSVELRKLGLVESLTIVTTDPVPAIHIQGSKQIDTVWVTPNIEIRAASLCIFNFSTDNHLAFIVDIDITSILGDKYVPICSPSMRRLISSNEFAV